MYAVVRHTYQLDIPDPTNPNSTKSSAKWVHLVWIFDAEIEAITFAISLLSDPLIQSNDWLFESAIRQLKDNRFYQLGNESVAIAEVKNSPTIIFTNEENEDEISIH